jgi:hypothetical protein
MDTRHQIVHRRFAEWSEAGLCGEASPGGPRPAPTRSYDIPDCHRALRERRIGDRIARRGIEMSDLLSSLVRQ